MNHKRGSSRSCREIGNPRRFEWASIAVYLTLGWSVVIFMQPLLAALDRPTLILLVSGGVLYSIGAGIHRWRRLPFHDAIWHGLVLLLDGIQPSISFPEMLMCAPPAFGAQDGRTG